MNLLSMPMNLLNRLKSRLLRSKTKADWERPFHVLRRKWHQVPAGSQSLSTDQLLQLPDRELLARWERIRLEAISGHAFRIRGWYHDLYRDLLRGKRVMDVGSGLGIDAVSFAQNGARMTCVDIVESNLKLLARIKDLLGLNNIDFHYMEDIGSLSKLPTDFDVIWCQGSLINAPYPVIRSEVQELLKHLPVGGRWIELAYPKSRWERDGCLPFERWGVLTDGPGTPWMEWYDLEKLNVALDPAKFDVILHFEFQNGEFNWFDLIRRD